MARKRKMKKKNVMLFSLTLILLICIITGSIWFLKSNKEGVDFVFAKKSVEINEKIVVKDLITEVKRGKLLSEDQEIDTTKLGKVKISVEVETTDGQRQEQELEIEVVDTTAPVIQAEETLYVVRGSSFDPLRNVIVTDNSKEPLKATVEGTYDLNQEGEYKITYRAKDSSGNEISKISKIIVQNKISSGNNTNDKVFQTVKGFKGEIKNGVTYIDGILIANKSYALPENYGSGLTTETQNAFQIMKNAASKEGITLTIISGYRSYQRQNELYHNYVSKDGKQAADTYSARPGHSEHQTGLAFDLNSLNTSFARTKEGKWLTANAAQYGFILRYPEGKTNETGYIYEPWHFRYVGVELAAKLYNQGDWITLEDYFGITSEYEN